MEETFLSVCNYHAPLKREKVRNKPVPLLTSDLKKMMFDRDRLKKIADIKNREKLARLYLYNLFEAKLMKTLNLLNTLLQLVLQRES